MNMTQELKKELLSQLTNELAEGIVNANIALLHHEAAEDFESAIATKNILDVMIENAAIGFASISELPLEEVKNTFKANAEHIRTEILAEKDNFIYDEEEINNDNDEDLS